MPIIRLEMLTGRTHAQKSELAEVLTRETARIARCPLADVQLVITEVERSMWSVGGTLAEPTSTNAVTK
ncbi:MAG TPA: tautomerase family protein [Paraburkholderia sp.]|jgi:4-oxalocrotonate tautomerase|uniref:tautomerase family protein n=1 Tax=Paraburkholderia sp. TaxID=1926495 RepID=UPI002B47D5F1|nr:tautomerase family protein [Paraburkholderia sp.]HKR47725.1 tautomerase family protein [Paraburkholderia sp.]